MYYSGLPFNEYSLIININSKERYFVRKQMIVSFCKEFYEGIIDGKVDLVIYQEAKWNDLELLKYHNSNYPNIPFFTENRIQDYVYKTTKVSGSEITSFTITSYDNIWRVDIEQIFDEFHLLLEYRKMYYNGSSRIPTKEKIFFSSWHISEDLYS